MQAGSEKSIRRTNPAAFDKPWIDRRASSKKDNACVGYY